jgi:hypothetical protein
MTRVLFVASLLVVACAERRDTTADDQAALAAMFAVPAAAKRVEWITNPGAGFGQREGLMLVAAYELDDATYRAYATSTAAAWTPLPIAADVRAKIMPELPVPLDAARGAYACATYGDAVLRATGPGKPCADAARLSDVRLAILDEATHRLSLVVKARY